MDIEKEVSIYYKSLRLIGGFCFMSIWQAIVLGVIQGIAEFLPISSSGHLILLQRVFGLDLPGMVFDIIVHLGSLVAVFVVFWRDIWELIKRPFQKMTLLLIIGTLPVVVSGFLFRNHIEEFSRNIPLLALMFFITGIILCIADKLPLGTKSEKEMSYLDALVVGVVQALAIFPGISRSGSTITGGLATGLTREMAARFSFLLSIISIIGASVLEIWVMHDSETAIYSGDIFPFIIGFVAAALSSYFAIRLLLQLIRTCKLRYFSYYLFILVAWMLLDYFVLNWFF